MEKNKTNKTTSIFLFIIAIFLMISANTLLAGAGVGGAIIFVVGIIILVISIFLFFNLVKTFIFISFWSLGFFIIIQTSTFIFFLTKSEKNIAPFALPVYLIGLVVGTIVFIILDISRLKRKNANLSSSP